MPAPLEIDYTARRQVASLVLLGVFLLVGVLAWIFRVVPSWLGAADTVIFGAIVVYGLVSLRRIKPGVAVARLDEHGVTVSGAQSVPWSDMREVVVGPMRPAWFLGSRRMEVVSFMPRPGVQLPGPPRPDGPPQASGRRFRERFYGTNLLLLSSATLVGGRRIAEAAHELGGLPVRQEPYRPLRRWLVGVAVAVLVGLGIGFLSDLVG